MKKHAYFVGIAGKTIAPLAKMFKDLGWRVTGSDQAEIYPPISTYLRKNKISYCRGYAEENLEGRPDLVVVGRSALLVNPQNPEYLKAKKLGLKVLSHPETLREYIVRKNSVVVAGTYGKTTISALMSWILEVAGLNPSFMTSGVPLNFPDGVRGTDSLWSVIEGDEPPAMKETDPSKFMFYKPKYVILTACRWDHPEVFPSEKAYLGAFIKFVKLIPKDGLLVVCREGENNEVVAKKANCPVVWYSTRDHGADFWMEDLSFRSDFTQFTVVSKKNGSMIALESPLLGLHNVQNVCGAVALALNFKIDPLKIQSAVKTFSGVRTRLEFLGKFKGVEVYWDFAQHPFKVKEALAALRTRYPKEAIFCVFHPHQNMLQRRESLSWYSGSFDKATEVIVARFTFFSRLARKDRVTGKDIAGQIAKTQPNVHYLPLDKEVINFLVKNWARAKVVIFMSSGGQKVPEMIKTLAKKLGVGISQLDSLC
ncbi:hypothetical protein FJZ40_00015 [Candidatus Shapirobacteria bacterium]|nr:hypothetical protein [Candidatus Shapirobacteria bacterium]